jgi:hypothetical protein
LNRAIGTVVTDTVGFGVGKFLSPLGKGAADSIGAVVGKFPEWLETVSEGNTSE